MELLVFLIALLGFFLIPFWLYDYFKARMEKTNNHPIYVVAAANFGIAIRSLVMGSLNAALQVAMVTIVLFSILMLSHWLGFSLDYLSYIPSDIFGPNVWILLIIFLLLVHINSTRYIISNPKDFFIIDETSNSIVLDIGEEKT